ncbi:MAG: hypothetical protein N2544_07555 [Burkholderiales bacterium]|nr:hypothetical protein [Burkholderiales bacterium]
MLKEIEGVRQDEPGRARRWFHDAEFDLFLWQAPDGQVLMFQLCYGGPASDRALVWREDLGFFHDGEPPAPGEPFSTGALGGRFARAAGDVPAAIREFVLAKIDEYAVSPPPGRAPRRRFRREHWQLR